MILFFCIPDEVEYDGEAYFSNPISVMLNRYARSDDKVSCVAPVKRVGKGSSDKICNGSVEFQFIDKMNSFNSLLNWNVFKTRLNTIIEKCDACIIHVHSSFVSNLAFEIAHQQHKPILTVVCGCPWDALWNYSLKGKLLAPFAYLWLKRVQQRAQYSIYVTSEFLQNRYPTCGQQINCSNVELNTYQIDLATRYTTILSGRRFRIATVAAVDVKYKGQQYIIKALKKLRDKGIEFEYYIVGSGNPSYLKRLTKKYQVEDLVFFTGPIKHSEIFQFLDDIDIYAQPSKQEGLPRAVIEAMSRGCLCIGSKIAGIPELIEPEFLFRAGNISQIVDILKNIDNNVLKEQARKNVIKAQQYSKSVLDERRSSFLNEFKNDI